MTKEQLTVEIYLVMMINNCHNHSHKNSQLLEIFLHVIQKKSIAYCLSSKHGDIECFQEVDGRNEETRMRMKHFVYTHYLNNSKGHIVIFKYQENYTCDVMQTLVVVELRVLAHQCQYDII